MNAGNQDPWSRQSFYIRVLLLLLLLLLFQGCYQKTLALLRDNLMIIGGIGVAVAVIQVCQDSYSSWKTLKVVKFYLFIFQAWKGIAEFNIVGQLENHWKW